MTPELPMPSERFQRGIVIASTWLDDDPDRPLVALVLLLNAEPPYYTVAQIVNRRDGRGWPIVARQDFGNINPAVTDGYAQWGGDQ